MVNIISDRGSNFVKGFRCYDPLFCFGHRLNNIIKTSFFQNERNKKRKTESTSTIGAPSLSNDNMPPQEHTNTFSILNHELSSEEESEDDEESVLPLLPIVRKRRTTNTKSTNGKQCLSSKMSINDIPAAAKDILLTLSQCKKLVTFIKHVDDLKFVINNSKR